MKFFYTDHFELPLPDTHTFPMSKYRLLRQRILADDTIPDGALAVPEAATDAQLRRVHTTAFIQRVTSGTLEAEELRRIGFPWTPYTVERSRRSVGATVAAAHACLKDGYGVNLAGGTHHSFADAGAGYCVFNDVAVAIRELQFMGLITNAAVVDCDAHQGDGTAVVFQSDPSVFTFSIHARKAFPARKQRSSLDIELEDRTEDAEYLEKLSRGLTHVGESIAPDIVFYVAGADPYHADRLGRLGLTKSGLARRDELVLDWARSRSAPVAASMAGGYSQNVTDIVDIHFETVRQMWNRSVADCVRP